ncbi:hypothetical protein GMB51_09960 [Turicibacter sanguinis]|nr:hypothetical protein [Turicibacter sanguinis]MTN51461.1 hypothetical protein [Turicibacter sanguinis]MTN54659.1 hypothetical protein [Turicibacter sanguinis]MTN57742.1 hypothetical protein [Turicibacter sanguinis]MTN60857.1 hypothetical protein [Turicibacter sanguinis]
MVNTIILVSVTLIFVVLIAESIKKMRRNRNLWKCIKWKLIGLLLFLGIFIISNLRIILADVIFLSNEVYNVEILWHSIISFEIGDYQNSIVLLNYSAIIGLVGSLYCAYGVFKCRKERK